MGSILGSGRSSGGEYSNPFLYPCLKNPMDREAWRPAVHGVTKNQTQLSKLTTTKTQTLYRGMVENIAIHLRENKCSIFVLLYYKGLSTPVLLPGKSQGQRSLVGYRSQGCKRVRQNLVTTKQQRLVIWQDLLLPLLIVFYVLQFFVLPFLSCRVSLVAQIVKNPHAIQETRV